MKPPQIKSYGAGYGFVYTCYLHSISWLLRKSVAAVTGTGDLFDKQVTVPTPGLGEGNVRISVCLPKTPLVREQDSSPIPFILVAEGGGFVLGQPSDGEHIDRMLSDEVISILSEAELNHY